MQLEGKTALITGSARGIGRGIAEALLDAGAQVMLADIGAGGGGGDDDWAYALASGSELAATREALGARGTVDAVHVDVTRSDSCDAAVQATLARFGALDILVNNAGIVGSGPIDHFDEAEWDRIFAVNTKGLFLMTRAAVDALRASSEVNDDACIINTASIAGKKGFPNMSAYCGSKFAAIGITQSLSAELAPDNIRVNAICPGMVGTAMWLEHLLPTNATSQAQKGAEFEAMMHETIPLGRPQSVEDMGQAAVYLAAAGNVTGIALTVAGGFEMN